MKNKLERNKFIIVLGTTFSGSGAVFDYLKGRGDLYEPLSGQEYLLPILPNGLMTLEAISGKAFDPAKTEFALIEFENTASKLINFWSGINDLNLNKKLPLYRSAIEEFINDVSLVDYPMKLFWQQLNRSPIQQITEKFRNYFSLKKKVSQKRLLVSQDKLIIAAQKMHNKMFQPQLEGYPILLDQAGSGWNPIESTKYFSDCKIILVTRDPRDQFVDIKNHKRGNSVKGFIDWYKEMQRRLKLIDSPNIFLIKFEDFVLKNENFLDNLCNYLSISSKTISSYKSEFSKKNIGKFYEHLEKNELKMIESNLGQYFYEEK
ncbi:sulfotransferase [Candidatus Pelagibacter sp.]|nr:sulfotransferase [Candidatus Pelagibacter sp.]